MNPHRRIFRSGGVWARSVPSAIARQSRKRQVIPPLPLEHLKNSRSSSRSNTNSMKRTFVGTAALVLVMATAGMAQSAPAAAPATANSTTSAAATPASSIKVGIIDIQQAIVATNEGARDFEALQKKFEPKKNELAGQNTEVENLKKQLQTQGDKMNEEARNTLVKSIETKQKSLQRSVEDAQNEYQQQQNEIAQRILQKMAPVIDKYAKSNGYGLLFDSSNPWPQGPLLWATATVDLTKTIVDNYNTQSGVAPPATKPTTTGKPLGAAPAPAATKPAATTAH